MRVSEERLAKLTLTYVGFCEDKASQLWDEWVERSPFLPQHVTDCTSLEYVTSPIDTAKDTVSDDDDDWIRCMNKYGLCDETQEAILDPNFKHIRLTQSCAFWAKETVTMRFLDLQARRIREDSKQLEIQHQQVNQACPSRVPPTPPTPQSKAKVTMDLLALVPPPTCLRLYKTVHQSQIKGAGENSENLLTLPPSDFGQHSTVYFTADYQVARLYAAYAKRRVKCKSIFIASFTIPESAFELLREPAIQRVFWPSQEWKDFVWLSRNRRPLKEPLRKYRDATVFIGSIPRKFGVAGRLQGSLESPERVTKAHVLKVVGAEGPRPAVQHAFVGEDGVEFLTSNVSHINICPFKRADLKVWVAENGYRYARLS